MPYREIAGVGNKAHPVSLSMECLGFLHMFLICDSDVRMQGHLDELTTAIGGLFHDTLSLIHIARYHNFVHSAEVQVPEHVTGGDRGKEQILWVVPRLIPEEGRIGGGQDLVIFSLTSNGVTSAVRLIVERALAFIARPFDFDLILVLFHR